MPGFGNNTQIINGGAVSAGASGSVRFPLTPFATRDPFTGQSHTADTINFKKTNILSIKKFLKKKGIKVRI